MKLLSYLTYSFIFCLVFFPKQSLSQHRIFLESGPYFNPFKGINIKENGIGYYSVEFENFHGYNLQMGYLLQLSAKHSIGLLARGAKLKTSYTLRLIDPLDEIQPGTF